MRTPSSTAAAAAEIASVEPLERLVGPVATTSRGLFGQVVRSSRAWIGLGLTGFVLLVALAGPLLAPHQPTDFVGLPFQAPNGHAVLGTDGLGRDVFSRLLSGGRTLIFIAFAATCLGVGVGATLGVAAGMTTRWYGDFGMRVLDLLQVFPPIVLVLMMTSMLGTSAWLLAVLLAVGFLPIVARVLRSVTIETVEQDFIRYCRQVGERPWRILTREILPNVTGPLVVQFGFLFTASFALIAAFNYLGLGAQPPTANWGLMISENQAGLSTQPWSVLAPVALIGILAVGVNLLADAIGEAFAGIRSHG
jgi:peptide/nickel transport system permease protein